MTGRLSLDFIGHSAVVIDLDGVRLLTDPVTRARVGPLRRVEPVPARDRLRDVDAVLISHLHWDHLDVPSLRDLGRDTPMFVPAGAGPWMRERRVHATSARWPSASRSTSAASWSGPCRPSTRATGRRSGRPRRRSGSSCAAADRSTSRATRTCSTGWAELGEPIDVALIPVWGWGPTLGRGLHLDPLRAAQSLRLIRPRAAVPIHWGTYWPHALGRVFPERLVEPPAAFVEYAAELAPDVQTAPTAVGDVVEWQP